MLILARKLRERIRFSLPGGDTIWVSVESIGSNTVKIGIEAPMDVEVMREELTKEGRLGRERWTRNPDTTKTR